MRQTQVQLHICTQEQETKYPYTLTRTHYDRHPSSHNHTYRHPAHKFSLACNTHTSLLSHAPLLSDVSTYHHKNCLETTSTDRPYTPSPVSMTDTIHHPLWFEQPSQTHREPITEPVDVMPNEPPSPPRQPSSPQYSCNLHIYQKRHWESGNPA